MYHEYGDAFAVAGTKGGQPTHPAWFHNLMANPDTTIQIGPGNPFPGLLGWLWRLGLDILCVWGYVV